MRVGLFVHLYHRTLFQEFCGYIDNVMNEFSDTVLLVTLENNVASKLFTVNLKIKYPQCHVLYIENKGVDIFSLLTQLRYVRANNINLDYILKIHTKVSSNDDEQLMNWRQQAITPITNPTSLKIIKNILAKTTVGYIAAQDCILPKSYDNDFPLNLVGIREFTDRFGMPSTYIDFIAGTLFWMNMDILNHLSEPVIDYIVSHLSEGKPPCNLTSKEIHVEYVLERLLTGPLCFHYTNVLINSNVASERDLVYQPKLWTFHSPSEIIQLIT
jgi:lipopolysaccharide biosynthesis protein